MKKSVMIAEPGMVQILKEKLMWSNLTQIRMLKSK